MNYPRANTASALAEPLGKVTGMVEVELRAPPRGPADPAGRVVCRLRVEGEHYELAGDRVAIDFSLPAPHRREHRGGRPVRRLRFHEDPEEWARNLEAVYRGPELVAVTVEDTNPLPSPPSHPRLRALAGGGGETTG